MSITLKTITNIFDEKNIHYDLHDNGQIIISSLQTKNYTDKDGDLNMPLLISLNSTGTLVLLIVPFCYQLPENADTSRIFEFFLYLNMRYHLVKFGYDPKDGEIQARCELFLGEGPLEANQLLSAIHTLFKNIDSLHPDICKELERKGSFTQQDQQRAKDLISTIIREGGTQKSDSEESSPGGEDPSSDDDLWI